MAMAVVKAIVSFYRAVEEKPIERYKGRIKIEEPRSFPLFRENVINLLELNDRAKNFGLGSFYLRPYRLANFVAKPKIIGSAAAGVGVARLAFVRWGECVVQE